MPADPYKALGLEHSASIIEIKRAYRTLASKLHPDKLIRVGASESEIQAATTKFAAISAAYSILSDETRKRHYDHIYKYGGYDHLESLSPTTTSTNEPTRNRSAPAAKRHNPGFEQARQPQKGIGYTVYDPFTFIMSQGKVKTKTVAGVSIPSRLNMIHAGHGGLRLSVSSGHIKKTNSGTLELKSKTTQFAAGKKLSRSETTTIYRDGRKEVVIEGDDYVERRVTAVPKRKRRPSHDEDDLTRTGSPDDDTPWYINAWNGVRDTVQMCNCGIIRVR